MIQRCSDFYLQVVDGQLGCLKHCSKKLDKI